MRNIINHCMSIISYPGYKIHHALLTFEAWNGPEVLSIMTVIYSIFLLVRANIKGFESTGQFLGLCLLLSCALVISLPVFRFFLDLFLQITSACYKVYLDCVKRRPTKVTTLEEYILDMKKVSCYGFISKK